MEHTKAKKLPGILLFSDFCKACHATEWIFIHKYIVFYWRSEIVDFQLSEDITLNLRKLSASSFMKYL